MEYTKIYLDQAGYFCGINEWEQIIWFWTQQAKQFNTKSQVTKYWLNLYERHGDRLLKIQAFELYAEIKKRATDEKISNREKWRKKHKEKAEAEMKAFEEWYKNHKDRAILLQIRNLN